MTRFGTATEKDKYSLSFETDNHEHFEYMQRAARFCVDGHFFGANLNFQQLQEELTRAKADVKRFADINDSLIEDNEALQKKLEHAEAVRKRIIDADAKEREELHAKINRLTQELADERDRFDKLSDFELAQAKELREAKLYLNIAMAYLEETGYDVEKLEKIIALKRCIMKLEETNE